ncbi:MAG: DUF1830 domain-containing protein [Leptolyngbya sp. RL_3_1]|nr:DUF1830 domain-containing protein [Leptolyngbya sp. RL_3_1]
MTQTLDALPLDRPDKILCCYQNPWSELQIIRITNIPYWYFERVVFAHDRCLFEAVPGAMVEIYRDNGLTTVLANLIPCEHLQMATSSSSILGVMA